MFKSRMSLLDTTLENFMQQTKENLKIQGASLQNLEIQIEQISRQMVEQQGTFPSDKIVNTKDQCKTVTWEDGQSCANPRVEDKFKEDEEATHRSHLANDSSLEQAPTKASTQVE